MAKAKKTSTPTDGTGGGKKAAAKGKKPAPPAAPPMVDTALAAQAAARHLVAGLSPTTAAPATGGKESAAFKALKQTLANPTAGGLDGVLDRTALPGSRKSDQPFAGPKGAGGSSAGRNQTFGADVNRTGVPRRTSGG